jgi:hypothetical protein
MARVLVAAQTPLASPYFPATPLGAGTATLAEQAADVALKNYAPIVTGKTYILAHNTDVGAHTVTFTSIVDAQNRTGDITTYSIAAGGVAWFGPFVTSPAGWSQSGNQVWFEANDATVKFVNLTVA